MTREQIIVTAARIAEIRHELARLGPLQKELKQLEAQIDGIADTPAPMQHSTVMSSSGSLFVRTIAVIESKRDKEWTSEEVTTALGANLASVCSALSKAQGCKRITKLGRGRFCANTVGADDMEIIFEENSSVAA